MVSGVCQAKSRGGCRADYYQTAINPATFLAERGAHVCNGGYFFYDLNEDYMYPIWDGRLATFGPTTLCGADSQMIDGKCEKKTRGLCKEDFYKTNVNANTFLADRGEHVCNGGYFFYDLNDDYMYPVWNGRLATFGPTLCGADSLYRDGACVPRSRGDCDDLFYDLRVSDQTMIVPDDGLCATSYSYYSMIPNCGENKATAGLCSPLCGDGLIYTSAGTCATRCDVVKNIMTSTGISIPLWSSQQTSRALAVGIDDTVCYGNLIKGANTGTINVNADNQVYHAKD